MADGGGCEDREQFWRDHIAGWKSSGLSLRLYSEEQGLKAGTLSYWSSRLTARSAEAPAPSSGPEATFLAVRVAEPAVAMPMPESGSSWPSREDASSGSVVASTRRPWTGCSTSLRGVRDRAAGRCPFTSP